MNESGPAGIEVWANFLSKFCVQLPWTTSSPPVKGDYHVFSNSGFIRHGAVVCRIFYPNFVCSCLGPLVVHL